MRILKIFLYLGILISLVSTSKAKEGIIDDEKEIRALNQYDEGILAYEKGNYKTAFTLWLPLAEDEYYLPQWVISELYFNGKGVEQDNEKGLYWLKKSASHGNDHIQYKLAEEYRTGEKVSRNPLEAIKWYKLSEAQGNIEAEIALARMYGTGDGIPKDDVEASRRYLRLAELGIPEGLEEMAIRYHYGIGIEKNKKEEQKWQKKLDDYFMTQHK